MVVFFDAAIPLILYAVFIIIMVVGAAIISPVVVNILMWIFIGIMVIWTIYKIFLDISGSSDDKDDAFYTANIVNRICAIIYSFTSSIVMIYLFFEIMLKFEYGSTDLIKKVGLIQLVLNVITAGVAILIFVFIIAIIGSIMFWVKKYRFGYILMIPVSGFASFVAIGAVMSFIEKVL